MNNVVLIGRLTRDVDFKKTSNDVSTCTFSVAVDKKTKDSNGDKQTDFINCCAWRHSADFLKNYCPKGSLISLRGSIQTRNYKNTSGQVVYITEVICEEVSLLSKPSGQAQEKSNTSQQSNQNFNQGSYEDKDLPF